MKTVYIVIKDGVVCDAYADDDVDIVVYDLDCPDSEEKARALAEIEKLERNSY